MYIIRSALRSGTTAAFVLALAVGIGGCGSDGEGTDSAAREDSEVAPDGGEVPGTDVEPSDPDADPDARALRTVVGRAWTLRRYTASATGEIVAVDPATLYQLQLDAESMMLSGFIGCVATNGSYSAGDGFVVLVLGDRDAQTCITDAEEHRAQTSDILALLQGGEAGASLPLMVASEGTDMELLSADGRRLLFEETDRLQQQQ